MVKKQIISTNDHLITKFIANSSNHRVRNGAQVYCRTAGYIYLIAEVRFPSNISIGIHAKSVYFLLRVLSVDNEIQYSKCFEKRVPFFHLFFVVLFKGFSIVPNFFFIFLLLFLFVFFSSASDAIYHDITPKR